MINFDSLTVENTEQHNPNWQQIFGYSQTILITGNT